jgi:hypothetical protein
VLSALEAKQGTHVYNRWDDLHSWWRACFLLSQKDLAKPLVDRRIPDRSEMGFVPAVQFMKNFWANVPIVPLGWKQFQYTIDSDAAAGRDDVYDKLVALLPNVLLSRF